VVDVVILFSPRLVPGTPGDDFECGRIVELIAAFGWRMAAQISRTGAKPTQRAAV
jgi:hypothetical protein